jgi:cephalosporin hydroxylase
VKQLARLGPECRRRAATTAREWAGPIRRKDFRAVLRLARRAALPMDREYRRRYNMKLRDWLTYHQRNVVLDKCTWMGVPALKNPLDAWIYQEIVHEVHPDVIVEIGSFAGGGTLFLAHLLELLGNGVVVSVDFDRSQFSVAHPRIRTVTGRSDDPDVLGEVRSHCDGKRVLVIHDADHRKAQVLRDLTLYAPLVSVGSYLIVEDGVVDLFRPNDGIGLWAEGPMPACKQFLKLNHDFQVDQTKERYLLTYNPRGFLLRVR